MSRSVKIRDMDSSQCSNDLQLDSTENKRVSIDLGHDGSNRFLGFVLIIFIQLNHKNFVTLLIFLTTSYFLLLTTAKKACYFIFITFGGNYWPFSYFASLRNITRLISTYQCTSSTADIARLNSVEDVARRKQAERESWMRRSGVLVTKAVMWSFSQLCTEMAGRNDFLLLSFENISDPNIVG